MKSLMVCILVAVAITATATLALSYENRYSHHQIDTCRFRQNDRWNDSEVRDTIRCIARFLRVRVHRAMRVAWCESRYKAYAVSASGTYRGVYQHDRSAWPSRQNIADRRNRWGIQEGIFNARSNVMVTLRMVRGGGWGPWSCA